MFLNVYFMEGFKHLSISTKKNNNQKFMYYCLISAFTKRHLTYFIYILSFPTFFPTLKEIQKKSCMQLEIGIFNHLINRTLVYVYHSVDLANCKVAHAWLLPLA